MIQIHKKRFPVFRCFSRLAPPPTLYGMQGQKWLRWMEPIVPPPSPPSRAEVLRRGTTLPLGQPLSHTPPVPASRHPPPLFAHILQQHKDCVERRIWVKLVFETRGGDEEYSFFCSPQPGATAATTAAGRSHRKGRKKCPPNKRQREQARMRREARIERGNHSLRSCNITVSTTTAACTAAAGVITAAAATTVAKKSSAADSIAAATWLAAALTAAAEPADWMSAAAQQQRLQPLQKILQQLQMLGLEAWDVKAVATTAAA